MESFRSVFFFWIREWNLLHGNGTGFCWNNFIMARLIFTSGIRAHVQKDGKGYGSGMNWWRFNVGRSQPGHSTRTGYQELCYLSIEFRFAPLLCERHLQFLDTTAYINRFDWCTELAPIIPSISRGIPSDERSETCSPSNRRHLPWHIIVAVRNERVPRE